MPFSRPSQQRQGKPALSGRRRMPRQPAVPACIEPLEPRLVLSTLTVTTETDVVSDGDGLLSLREAVLIANDSTGATAFDGVSSTDLADVISFSDGVFDLDVVDTIQLAGTQLPSLIESLTINGAIDAGSARITIDAAGQSRIFDVVLGATLRLEDMVLANGNSGTEDGGAIRNAGDLELVDTDLTASTSFGSGGALSNTGTVTIIGGSISGNTTDVSGGGVFNDGGTVTITGTVIENNTAGVQGGGVFNDGTMTMSEATIDGNRAESPFSASPLAAGNILINNDPFGPANLMEFEVDGTLVRTLPLTIGQDITLDEQGRVQVYAAPDLITFDPGTQTETTVTVPGWSSVGNLTYGGLDAFRHFVFGTDQETANEGAPRGIVRIDTRDGSWTRFGDIDCFDLNVGLDGLLYVLSTGNAINAGGTRITVFDPLTTASLGTIDLPVEVRAIAIDSAGEIFTAGMSGIQHFDANGNLLDTLSTAIGGLADIDIRRDERYLLIVSHGGEFVVTTPALDTEDVFNSGVSDNVTFGTFIQPPVGVSADSQGAGGGVFNAAGASLTITGGEITANFALLTGGALHNDGGTLTIDGALIDANTTGGDGAGLHNSGSGSVTVTGVTISNNAATGTGGGIWISASGTLTLLGSTIAENAAQSGAGLFVASGAGTLNITDSTISGNVAVTTGGGIRTDAGTLTLANSTVSGNHAQTSGGGIRANGGTLQLLSTTVAANIADASGGGLDQQGAVVSAQSTIIATNSAAVSAADVRGTLQSNGFNLIGNTAGATIAGALPSDIVNVDPMLGPLQDNGGPTLTHALDENSVAVNAGFNAAGSALDQRGAGRTFGGQTDIGAYEFHIDARVLIAAPASGGGPAVRIFSAQTGDLIRQIWAYTPSFLGGVSVAAADLTGDGFPEIITGPGPGGGPLVRIFDGASGAMLNQFFAFNQAFRGGINVAAGDVDGDGTSEVIVAPRAGGGPAVRVFNALTGAQIGEQIWAFDLGFFGGVRLATGDTDGNGTDEIIAVPGPTGGPAFRVFSALTGTQIGDTTFVFDPNFGVGLSVAAGDLDGDGDDEIVVGPTGGGIGPLVRVFDGFTRAQLSEFFAFGQNFQGGVALATGDTNADGQDEVIAGAGPGGGPAVRVFDALAGTQVGDTLFAFGTAFRGGVVVAGVVPPFLTGSPLTIQSTTPAEEDAPVLTSGQLSPVIAAATARLHETALSADLLAGLSSTQFVVTDLPGDLLGLAQRGRIYLDNDAAGYGWFVDYSPLLDEEFSSGSDRLVAIDSRAAGRIDLLSVVLHELGHVLGLDHADAGHLDARMSATLQPGVRRLPAKADLDALFEREQAWDLIAV